MPRIVKSVKRPWVIPSNRAVSRVNPNREIYDSSRWKKDSSAHRKNFPLCATCLKRGTYKASKVSDHVIPINQGGDVWDWDNRQALCIACHNSKSAKEGGRLYKGEGGANL